MRTTHHTIFAPAADAAERMPSAVRLAGAEVALIRDGRTSTWRWEASLGGGTATLSRLSADATRLTVTPDAGTPLGTADALTAALYGVLERQWQPPLPESARRPMRRRTKILTGVAAVLVPLLAVTGMRVLAPPAPVDVASAVAQFRAQSAQQSDPVTGGGGGGNDAGGESDEETGRSGGDSDRQSRPDNGNDDGQRTAVNTAADRQSAAAPRAPSNAAAPTRTQDNAGASSTRREATGADARQPSRRQAQPQREAVATAPEEGVYRYATSGYESIDRPSDRHDYPRETAMSVRATDCGFTARWQPLENRWDEMSVCRRGGDAFLPTLSTHREFYGQENDNDYRCSAGNYAYRPEPGATWTGTCADGDAKMQIRGRTFGREAVQVGNEVVETVHYTIDARIYGGDAEGTWSAERWVDPDNGLLIRVEAQTRATSQSTVGPVQYREQLSLRLLSMTPQR